MEEFNLVYRQSIESLQEGDIRHAFLSSKKCQLLSAEIFNTANDENLVRHLQNYFKAYKLIYQCYEKICCPKCLASELNLYYNNFLSIHTYKGFHCELRRQAGEFLDLVFKDYESLLINEKRWVDLQNLRETHGQEYRRLVLV